MVRGGPLTTSLEISPKEEIRDKGRSKKYSENSPNFPTGIAKVKEIELIRQRCIL